MTWVKLDDKFHRNSKQLRMSDAAFRAYVRCLSYAADLPRAQITGFLTMVELAAQGATPKVMKELTDAAMNAWEPVNGGILIHDFEDYLPKSSTAKVRAWREAKRQEGSNTTPSNPPVTVAPAQSNGSEATAQPKGNRHSHARAHPEPEPVPVISPPSPPPSPEALELQVALSGLIGQTFPKGTDALTAMRMWSEFGDRYDGVADMVETVRLDLERRHNEDRQPLHSLEGCRLAIRWEYDTRADAGRLRAREQSSRTDGEPTRIDVSALARRTLRVVQPTRDPATESPQERP